ncbi:MAG: hypothetical protein SFU98_15790 [Leptospiraceae bacterium]|nr:hypothetical protein [Leptospiraceae bacterium]
MKVFFKKVFQSKTFRFLFILTILYKCLFNSFSGEIILKKIFPTISTGTLEVNVKRFSLFFGFILEDVKILSGDDFEKKPILESKRIAATYNIPLLFLGRLKISEVSLIEPKLTLAQRNGKWNYETLFPPSNEKKVEEEETSTSNELDLYVPISAFANIFIRDLQLMMKEENGLELEVKNFSTQVFLDTKRFSKIPFSISVLNIIDTFKFYLNPENKLYLRYIDKKVSLETELNSRLILSRDAKLSSEWFLSEMNFGNEKIEFQKLGKEKKVFGFTLGYDLGYKPETDSLELKNFGINFNKDKLIEMKGSVSKLTTSNPNVDIVLTPSNLNLVAVGNVIKDFTNGIKLSGTLSIRELKAIGDFKKMDVSADLSGKNILVSVSGATHSIPILELFTNSVLNLEDKAESSEKDLIPILDSSTLEKLHISYNGIEVKAKGIVIPKSKVDLDLSIQNIQIENYTKEASGVLKAKVKARGEKLSYLNIDMNANLDDLRYKLGRSISGKNFIELNLKTVLDFGKNFKLEDLQLEPFLFKLKNESKSTGLELKSFINVDLKSGTLVELKKITTDINMNHLLPTVPMFLRGTISSLRSSLGEKLDLDGDIRFKDDNKKKRIEASLHGSFPGIELTDLSLQVLLNLWNDKESKIEIEKISLRGFSKKLIGDFSGKFYKPSNSIPYYGDYTGEFKGHLSLESETPRHVLKGIIFQGDIDFNLNLKDSIISGEIKSKDSNIQYKDPNCKEDCSYYDVSHLQMDIPYVHDVADKTTENLLDGNKQGFVKNYAKESTPNFSIQSVKGRHPVSNFKDEAFYFIMPEKDSPGLVSRIEYKENFLILDGLKIHCMNGFVYGKDFLVNVGNGDPEKMQYAGVLQIRDMDLEGLIPKSSRKKIDDGKIKADLNIKGRNLNDPVGNVDLFFNIFQIGKDFGTSAVNIVKPTNFLTDAIIASYNVETIEVELTKGLVYTKIQFMPSILSYGVGLNNDRIEQEKIPIASFLKRAENEAQKYK